MSHYVAENRKDILTGRKILRRVFAILRRVFCDLRHVLAILRHVLAILRRVVKNRKTQRRVAKCRKMSRTCRGKSQGHVAKFQRHVAKIKSWDFDGKRKLTLQFETPTRNTRLVFHVYHQHVTIFSTFIQHDFFQLQTSVYHPLRTKHVVYVFHVYHQHRDGFHSCLKFIHMISMIEKIIQHDICQWIQSIHEKGLTTWKRHGGALFSSWGCIA